ncbi:MAG: L-glutamate gamma-semialdehyde dehydrogenase [Chloroflexi bacterium]|nr:L-glutamate gamma-semialdehyde dehydrogenase [Chloroflexota bacterium]
MLTPFRNEPLTDFSQPENVQAFQAALEKVGSELGQTYPIIIGGERIETSETFDSINPANPSQVIGRFAKADADLARRAVEVAAEAFETWKRIPPEVRARYLLKAAAIMRARKHEFSAWMVYEVGKSWVEADADTAEAIDMLEFYAREMIRLGGSQPVVPYPGREADLLYIPLGVGAVIPPWNFPNAIMTGMTSASLVTGNTVVLKPASTAPTIAYKLVEIFNEELLLPPGVLNFLPGPGSVIGDVLVTHPKTRFISFTGSKEVGLRIHELAAKPQPGQIWIKRTILEMGGKDAVVVDETADLDAAAEGIVVSAFGYQGQKCSAGSRAILVDSIYDSLLERVVERARKITVGPTVDQSNWMGPVIDQAAFNKIMDYIEIGHDEGKLVLGGHAINTPEGGYFIEPTIFADVDRNARIAQEEIFGPVLSVIRARDFDDALEIANGTEYGLTGALFSRDRLRLERARHEFHVGNLYFNRKCTGALVGVEPFGGFNMSGTDSKAGGSDYLLLFMQAKSISELL